MNTIIIGAYGRVGTSLLDYQSDGFEYVPFDKHNHPELETVLGDLSEYESVSDAFKRRDAIVHLAAGPNVEAGWESIYRTTSSVRTIVSKPASSKLSKASYSHLPTTSLGCTKRSMHRNYTRKATI